MKPAIRYIIYGQSCFVAGLIVCLALKPHGLTANEGLSYYGVYRETILPYTLMLLGPAVKSLLGITVLIMTLRYWPDLFRRLFTDAVASGEQMFHLAG